MAPTTGDKEMLAIQQIAGSFLRHPRQVNGLFEADGEIIDFRHQQVDYLVFKSDGIREEIREGLYTDPFLIGWMGVTVTISDLAASGADPLGILLSLQIPSALSTDWIAGFQQGVNEACRMYDVPVLGGDTNFDDAISVNTTGIGTIRQTKPLLRKTVRPGDRLYTTGTMGAGNAFAYARFFDSTIVTTYQPVARLKESNIIRQYATACIDTSDGFFPALSVLSAVNAIGFRVAPPLQALLSTEATKTYMKAGIPSWTLLAGPHGEYELLFAVSPATEAAFNAAGASAGWQPLYVGECIAEQHLFFTSEAVQVVCEPSEIANLFHDAGGDVHHYFELLLRKHAQWQTIKSYSYAKD